MRLYFWAGRFSITFKMKDKNRLPQSKGRLYVVATPIGNLEDITFRAVRILGEVDLIAAEDTRRTRILLHHYHVTTPSTSYHEHNKLIKSRQLISRVKRGQDLALVSDAGTPGISDPGYHLINLAIQNTIPVIPVPGVSAAITALSVSGLPTDSFVFQGFLPRKTTARMKIVEKIKEEKRTTIFYESPHRLRTALEDLLGICGDREVVVARELTKIFEEVIRGRISDVIDRLKGRKIKGEITLLLSGRGGPHARSDISIREILEDYWKKYDLPLKDLTKLISEETSISKREIYQELLKLKK